MLWTTHTGLAVFGLSLIALVIGSFLNVVIYRLPLMHDPKAPPYKIFNLAWPGSFCPHCKTPLRIRDNIPLLSFMYLKGRCASCQQAISWRYPLIEALSLVLTLALLFHFGWHITLIPALFLTYSLLALAAIDINEQILPDGITLPLLWVGLAVNSVDLYTPAFDAIWGAVLGYTLLFMVDRLYYLVRKQSGIGGGDCKLFAALGAFFGVQALLPIILAASMLGLCVALLGMAMGKVKYHIPLAFGPHLAVAGWGYLFFM
ncbi:MAG TPA: A24 family peptidase [Gammaproteobacteria bacterium]|nr:A24 family peptidase [Gammaproteobacteria bacterium]